MFKRKKTEYKCDCCNQLIYINYVKNEEIDDNYYSCECNDEFYFLPKNATKTTNKDNDNA